MEVTLEKIELVKDRTGVTYKEAKEALEAADGNVVDAIVSIEDNTDAQTNSQKISDKGGEIVDKVKEVVARGNASKIVIRKDDEKVLDLPVNVGIIGAVIAPWGIILGVAAAFGFNCKIQVVKTDGTVVDITDKAGNLYDQAKEKGQGLYDQAKEKGEEGISKTKELSEEAAKKAQELKDKFMKKADEVEDAAEDAAEEAEDAVEDAAEEVEEAVEEAEDKAEE